MPLLPVILLAIGALTTLGLLFFALSGPSTQRAGDRRLSAVRDRHSPNANTAVEVQMRRLTGRTALGFFVGTLLLLLLLGFPLLLALFLGLGMGAGIPHFAVGYVINKRVKAFNAKFPDAIELLVRGLRSGLPITETMAVVGSEVEGPVGEEFRAVADKMKIGRSMDVALQETADRLGTKEFQFFVITIAIQRETGGNLAETLQNLATVLRQRAQMKLKIKAMSSESKASAMIIGALPFIVFILIWFVNSAYMQNFFVDQRLIVAGVGGMIWMSIGAFIMAKMVSFEI